MGVNQKIWENRKPLKSSILIGCSIINHPFGGTPIFGNTIMTFAKMQVFLFDFLY